MKIHMNTGGLAATNSYLLLDEATHKGVLIDAPRDTIGSLLALAREQSYDLPLLLVTHSHWDHIGDHVLYTQAFPNGKILIHPDAEPLLIAPGSSMYQLPYTIASRKADAYLQDDQIIKIGNIELKALHTPGHAPGHIAFYCAAEHFLIAGDLLFADSVGRWDLPESNLAQLQSSLRRVMTLPDETHVWPGHGDATTIGQERRANQTLKQLGVV